MTPTVLSIDDSAVIRASVAQVMKSIGVDTLQACDGQEGLELLQQLSEQNKLPALILVDVNMPRMDGITFIKKVKETESKFVPVLVLTTEVENRLVREGKAAGAAGWLTKPFKPEQLVTVVRKFVR